MQKPNILYILADDLGWGDVSYHGSPIETPNIDRLAQTGVELDYHYVCPVCTPTRTSLMTGRHPGRFGRHATVPSNEPVLPDGYMTLANLLKEAGYTTGLFGKWHLGSDPEFYPGNYGFDYSYGSLAGGVDPYTHRYKTGPHSYTWHRNGERISDYGHVTDLITDEAIKWIEANQDSDQPWFCYVPFTAVHTPVRAPEHWIDKYWNQKFDVDPERDRSFKVYAGYTSHMDYSIGRMIETLKCLDILDDTIVVFASDNGGVTKNPSNDVAKYPGRHDDMPRTGCNYPLRGHKSQLYEGGIRTPAVISWPGHFPQAKVEESLHISDWMPTFAGILGIEPKENANWDGMDISDLLWGKTEELPERSIYWNLTHKRFAIRQGDWKLIVNNDNEFARAPELFNIGKDPLEERDVAGDNPKLVQSLLEEIKEHRKLDDTAKRPDVQ